MMDEYARAAAAYMKLLQCVSINDFIEIKDPETSSPDCKSIQTITLHVVQSGYTYANYVRSLTTGGWYEYDKQIAIPAEGVREIETMLSYTNSSFGGLWEKSNEELLKFKIESRWNVTYDLEQLMEHAIVHILRHRRQVQQFIKMAHSSEETSNKSNSQSIGGSDQ